MKIFSEYESYDGLGLAKLIKEKKVSKKEVLDACLDRFKQWENINAIIYPMFDLGRDYIQSDLQGPFAGVPTLLKDLIAHYAGTPLSFGSKALKDQISNIDSELVSRIKKSGLVILGKTNAPEFGIMGTTEPECFGPTLNPWDTSRSPGGSSGGSAAAVAAGIVPFAHGGDGGGSIRIPASNCGLFGLKPTRGRTPTGPIHGEILDGAVVEHFITRSVRDSAAILDSIEGPEKGAPYQICRPKNSYLSVLESDPKKLKIAFSTQSILGGSVHPHVEMAIQKTVKLLKDLGHELIPDAPKIDGKQLSKSYLINICTHLAVNLNFVKRKLGRYATQKQVELITKTLGHIGTKLPAAEFVEAKRYWHDIALQLSLFHETYDLYLTPVSAELPALIGAESKSPLENVLLEIINLLGIGRVVLKSGLLEHIAQESFQRFPFTQIANLTGNPSMSVPLYWNEQNLPIGSMFCAPWGDEDTLFKLAGQLERAQNWFDKRPKIS
jgi:amidase